LAQGTGYSYARGTFTNLVFLRLFVLELGARLGWTPDRKHRSKRKRRHNNDNTVPRTRN